MVDFLEWDEIGSKRQIAQLSLLPGAQCTVRSIMLYACPRKAMASETTMQLVRLRGATDAVYHLRRLSQHLEGQRVFVYQLINMSDYDRLHRQHLALQEEKGN